MSEQNSQPSPRLIPRLSLDTWAVLVALLAAVLIRVGAIPRIPW